MLNKDNKDTFIGHLEFVVYMTNNWKSQNSNNTKQSDTDIEHIEIHWTAGKLETVETVL